MDITTLGAYSYGYDAANRMTQMTSGDGTSVYTYDHADQLTGVDYSYQADEAYSYDANGNRTNTGYGVGANNRLLSDGKNNFEYDAEGNLVKQTQIATGNVTQYTWDYRQRLTGVVTKNASGTVIKSASYTYNALDRRIAKVVDADGAGSNAPTVERFVYDGDHIAFSFNGSGTQTDRYMYGPYVDQVLVDEKATNNLLWTLPDHQGTVRDLANSTGTVQNHIRYGSFGNITSQSNAAVTTRYGYTGRELDAESGNYNYRARYTRPAIGRFISPDPIGFDAGDANLYRYVGNAPLNRIDPLGTSDMRWPWNGSVVNLSNQPVYPVIGNRKQGRIEKLNPGAFTPDAMGRSKDADGVWAWQKGQWRFYPNLVTPFNGGIVVKCDGVYDERGNPVTPWDGRSSDNSPAKRGGLPNNDPPDPRKNFPDASSWQPVAPEDSTLDDTQRNGLERFLSTPMSLPTYPPSMWWLLPSR